ncbi:hypothetical protein BZA05DRAFT_94418 [Tricharina praecox]|uniref:uncharacterized protein n=1 Tax=Tricharina praecox TaxID=43433 RepID=UPI0022200FE4|nr:uncharacterized protein BZA05DRAFT_94418 [Tricharina praecox]KAI5848314.1 hypothetical protein BZA05DRAFT_94418 [Tricharina praecox]
MANHKKPRGNRPQSAPRSNSNSSRPRGLKPPRDNSNGAAAVSDSDPSMAQSFLPFCAHCEKQIVVPNTSILFCSEKCKRKDEAKSPGQGYSYTSFGMTPPYSADPIEGTAPSRNYVQPLSPTRPVRGFDEDSLSRSMVSMNINTYTPESSRPNSGTTSPVDCTPGSPTGSTNSSNIYQPPRRPQHLRAMTSGAISTLSSISTTSHAVPVPTQYQYGGQQRPLPPLHRPHPFSTSPRSIDLVTPYMSGPVSPRAEPITTQYRRSSHHGEDERAHRERKNSDVAAAAAATAPRGSLRTLFNFDAIRGEPYVPEAAATSPEKYLTYSNGTPILARMSPTAVHFR